MYPIYVHISPRNNGSAFANSVLMANFHNITPGNNEN